ncbi:MAG: hypothetical protein O3B13_14480, partial [Planctomycetota bacterium]|nr:hypothetical protein [Planctomycetota bacterium]
RSHVPHKPPATCQGSHLVASYTFDRYRTLGRVMSKPIEVALEYERAKAQVKAVNQPAWFLKCSRDWLTRPVATM